VTRLLPVGRPAALEAPQPAAPLLRPTTWSLPELVEELCAANARPLRGNSPGAVPRRALPHRETVAEAVSGLRAALFPWHFGTSDVSEEGVRYYIGRTLQSSLDRLSAQARIGFAFDCPHPHDPCATCADRAVEAMQAFAARLPGIRAQLETDAWAAFDGDPAATSADETVFSYAGLAAITYHRLAHELHVVGVPLIPRIISELAHAATGIDIHPGARIGPRFFIDHGTGVVIGETCVIGANVRIYQGVTLGAKTFPVDEHGKPLKGAPRHPIIEDDVVIYAGATILGRITIGRGSSIGGNVWLTTSVPPGSKISQALVRQDLFTGGAGI
jgi:serine O-acetyltransferase